MSFTQTAPTILCCKCGIVIQSCPSAMCISCLTSEIDITEGIVKNTTIVHCSGCSRFLQPPNHWVACELESRELMAMVLKKLRGLSKVRLVDASWIYTEPHSKRLKVKVVVQQEVFSGTILQQPFIAELVIAGQQCRECSLYEAKDTWNSVAQIRQKVSHKKTFYWLEQLILKHSAHSQVVNVDVKSDGIDFYFGHRTHCRKFVEFVAALVPVRMNESKKLKGKDTHSGSASYRFTYSVEIIPVCHFDLVCLPKKMASQLGGVSPLLLCARVTNKLLMVDPVTLRMVDIQPQMFWNNPFRPLLAHRNLISYYIFDIEPLGPVAGKYVLAEAQIARESDFGVNDRQYTIITHLGAYLHPGDYALGYDLEGAVFNPQDTNAMQGREYPYHILVKKHYKRKRRQRHWKVKKLLDEMPVEDGAKRMAEARKDQADFEDFLDDIEEDVDRRQEINKYAVPNAQQILADRALRPMQEGSGDEDDDDEDDEDEEFPEVQLSELLQDTHL